MYQNPYHRHPYGALREPPQWDGLALASHTGYTPYAVVARNDRSLEHPVAVRIDPRREAEEAQRRAENSTLLYEAQRAGVPIYIARIFMPLMLPLLVANLISGNAKEKRDAARLLGKEPDDTPKPQKDRDDILAFALPPMLIASAVAGLNYLWAIPSALILSATSIGRRGLRVGLRAVQAVEQNVLAIAMPHPRMAPPDLAPTVSL